MNCYIVLVLSKCKYDGIRAAKSYKYTDTYSLDDPPYLDYSHSTPGGSEEREPEPIWNLIMLTAISVVVITYGLCRFANSLISADYRSEVSHPGKLFNC